MPSAAFCASVASNLVYWRTSAKNLDDKKLHLLDVERHNLLRAARFGIGLESTLCEAARLILQIYPLIERRGYWRRWIPLLEDAVKGCAETESTLTVNLLDRLGQCYRLDRQWEKSLDRHGREETLAQEIGDENLLAKSRLNLSQTYWSLRQYDQAVAFGEMALNGFTKYGAEAEQLGAAVSNLGLIALHCRDLAAAETWLTQAIDIYRSIDRPALLARSFMNLSITLERDGRNEEAVPICREALQILESTEHEIDKARLELTLGTLYFNLDQMEEAEAAYLRANSAALRRAGDTYSQTLLANNLGCVYMEMHRFEEAEEALNRSITFGRRSGARLMLANSLGSMAETKLAMNRPEEALPYLDESIAIAAEFPDDGWGRELLEKYQQMKDEL